jgi:hypothetical protein
MAATALLMITNNIDQQHDASTRFSLQQSKKGPFFGGPNDDDGGGQQQQKHCDVDHIVHPIVVG